MNVTAATITVCPSDAPWKELKPEEHRRSTSKQYVSAVAREFDETAPHSRVAGQQADPGHFELPETKPLVEEELMKQIDEVIMKEKAEEYEKKIAREMKKDREPAARGAITPAQYDVHFPLIKSTAKPNKSTMLTNQHLDRDSAASVSSSHREGLSSGRLPSAPRSHPASREGPPPPTDPPPPPPPGPPSAPPQPATISRFDAQQIGNIARSGKAKSIKDLPISFHALDFAGQKLYRPMHHCFITHRAMYIVVFNLQELVKQLTDAEV